ncbi:serine hydrolase domain-containing protein [Kitasatospora terrestris]|uniref:Beta-lactamase-related domain-containing protein n=1 Tax=Kitasatospora terrestris TaxID=258051 RepID=A0ABP9DI02_9ACTN
MALTPRHQTPDAWTSAAIDALGASLDTAIHDAGVPGGVLAVGQVALPADPVSRPPADRPPSDPPPAAPPPSDRPPARAVSGRGILGAECGAAAPDGRTRYDMASLTKVVATWPLIGRAVRDGLLDPDAPLRTYLPDAPAPGRDLTTRHLMTHTSGMLPSTGLARYQLSGRSLLDHLCAEPLVDVPGARHRYIDRGFVLLGLLLPIIRNRPLHELAAEFWQELGLGSTCYGPLARSARVAPTEARLAGAPRTWGIPHDPSAALLGGVAGHAGVFSTAADLATFAEHLLTPANPLADWFELSRQPATAVEPGLLRGLAWIVTADGTAAYHHGYTGTSLYLSPPTGRYIVLCTNAVYHGWQRTRLAPVRDLALRTLTS